jgi:hypothetical protein
VYLVLHRSCQWSILTLGIPHPPPTDPCVTVSRLLAVGLLTELTLCTRMSHDMSLLLYTLFQIPHVVDGIHTQSRIHEPTHKELMNLAHTLSPTLSIYHTLCQNMCTSASPDLIWIVSLRRCNVLVMLRTLSASILNLHEALQRYDSVLRPLPPQGGQH